MNYALHPYHPVTFSPLFCFLPSSVTIILSAANFGYQFPKQSVGYDSSQSWQSVNIPCYFLKCQEQVVQLSMFH